MGDILTMSKNERKILVELEMVKEGKQSLWDASLRLGKSYRQILRINQRFLREGDGGIIHKSRGRISHRGFPEEFRQKCLELYSLRMSGFGPTFAAEKLAELGYRVNYETLRKWLIGAGVWNRSRKRGPHRWRQSGFFRHC